MVAEVVAAARATFNVQRPMETPLRALVLQHVAETLAQAVAPQHFLLVVHSKETATYPGNCLEVIGFMAGHLLSI